MRKSFLSSIFLYLLSVNFSDAQTGTVSPYSRYGIGELQYSGFNRQIGMGRTGVALHSDDKINFLNPATYSFDTITTIEAGIRGEVTKLTSSSISQTTNGASISYFSLAFPISKKVWGASLGIVPYSSVGYNIVDFQESGCNCGEVQYTFTGDGDINRFYIGNGFSPFAKLPDKFYASAEYKTLFAKNDTSAIKKKEKKLNALKGLSVGFNASWLFGTLNNSRTVDFIDSTNFFDTRILNSNTLGDIYIDFGIYYNKPIRNNYFFGFGVTGTPSASVKTTRNSLWYNFKSSPVFSDIIKDTVQNIVDITGETKLPLAYTIGFSFGKKDKWVMTADYSAQNWSEYEAFGSTDNLRNSFSVSAGTELIPKINGTGYFQKMQYRFGLRYSSSYLQLRETQIKDYSVSLGFGLPIIKKDRIQRGTIQLAFEAGQNGTTTNNLLKQQYFRAHLGIVLNELWFIKRKYE